jgi:hypothetical protein
MAKRLSLEMRWSIYRHRGSNPRVTAKKMESKMLIKLKYYRENKGTILKKLAKDTKKAAKEAD